MESQVKLYSYTYKEQRTYLLAALFVLGNIVFPQLCHQVSLGGHTWLPIYFFTLVGAYKYGWKVGLMTAVLSPVANSLLFGMPMPVSLPAILVKSVLLAGMAGWAASRYRKASVALLCAVVLGYQLTGSLMESAMELNLMSGFQDFRIGIPGMVVQILGGWLVINKLIRN